MSKQWRSINNSIQHLQTWQDIYPLWAAHSSFHNNKQLKNSLLDVLQIYLGLVVGCFGRNHKRSTDWEVLQGDFKVYWFMQVDLKNQITSQEQCSKTSNYYCSRCCNVVRLDEFWKINKKYDTHETSTVCSFISDAYYQCLFCYKCWYMQCDCMHLCLAMLLNGSLCSAHVFVHRF